MPRPDADADGRLADRLDDRVDHRPADRPNDRADHRADHRADFAAYVAARRPALLRTAYLLVGGNTADAEDLVQTALVKAVPAWRRIRGHPDAYVRRILVNEATSRWRRRRWREVSTAVPPDRAAPAEHEADPDLRRALAALAPRQRAVVVLRYYEDLSEQQTADLLGISVGTVKSQARDALARLRALVPSE